MNKVSKHPCGANGFLRQYFQKWMELIDIAVEKVFSKLTGLDGRVMTMGIS